MRDGNEKWYDQHIHADGVPDRSPCDFVEGGDTVMWQIVEYRQVQMGPQLIVNMPEWKSSPMTQSEAIRRAQQMNDAAPSEERWYVAERM
jgi:hypothetical protein